MSFEKHENPSADGTAGGNAGATTQELVSLPRDSLEHKNVFVPFTYPFPNMIILPGTSVLFKNLTSAVGKELNDKQGTAKDFLPKLVAGPSRSMADGCLLYSKS